MGETYTSPSGETVEIPDDAEIVRDEAGEIKFWSNPPATPEGELHPSQVVDYEPKFDPLSVERRVLGHVTDDDHVGRGPRNTPERLALELQEDPFSRFAGNLDQMQGYLQSLESAGLVHKRDDGTYEVTEAGHIELAN